MNTITIGNTTVYVPEEYTTIPCGDWANNYALMPDGSWSATESMCEGYDEISTTDWLAYYTYLNEEGQYVFNGKQTEVTHLMSKYRNEYCDYDEPSVAGLFATDSDSDSE